MQFQPLGDEGLEEGQQTPEKQAISKAGGAPGGAMSIDPFPADLLVRWPHLPVHIRQAILTLVRSVKMPEQDVIDSAELNRAGKRVIIP